MAENDIKIKVEVTGESGAAIAGAVAEQTRAVAQAAMRPEDLEAFAAMRADKLRMAQEAANRRGAAVSMAFSSRLMGQVGTDDEGEPVMGPIGTISGSATAKPQAWEERALRNQRIKASYVAANIRDLKEDAAAHHIRFMDHLGGTWKPGTIEERLKVAQEATDPTQAKEALQDASAMAGALRKFTVREFDARGGELKRTLLTGRLDEAVSGIDLEKASDFVRKVIAEAQELSQELSELKRTSLATPEGRKRLSHFGRLTAVAAAEATRQQKDTAQQVRAEEKARAAEEKARAKEEAARVKAEKDAEKARAKEEAARVKAEKDAEKEQDKARAAQERDDQRRSKAAAGSGGKTPLSADAVAGLLSTAGQAAGIRAAVTSLQSAGQAFMGGNAIQGAGGLVYTAGTYMHHVGLGRMAAARRMQAGGGVGAMGILAGRAGGLLTTVGAGLMIGAKVITAGFERGYENSERADKLMAEAEPLFTRRAIDRSLATGGRGWAYDRLVARRDAPAPQPGVRLTAPGGISDAARGNIAEGAGYTLQTLMSATGAAGQLLGSRSQDIGRNIGEALADKLAVVNPSLSVMLGGAVAGARPDTHDVVNTQARQSMMELMRLKEFGLGPEEALKAYSGFSGAHGVGRRTLTEDITRMRAARLAGLPDEIEAEMLRVSSLNPRDQSGSSIQMARALAAGGVMGRPQHQVIASILQQIASEQASGMTPSTTVAGNAIESMAKVGVSYPMMPTIRGTASELVQGNLASTRGASQSILRGIMLARAFRGRTYEEGVEAMATEDPMAQMAGAYGDLPPALQRFAALGMAPGQRRQVGDALARMAARDLTKRPLLDGNDDVFNVVAAYKRGAALKGAEWGLIDQYRSIGAIEAGQTFKASLDDAADSLRKVGDVAARVGIGLTNFFGITTGGD